MHLRNDRCTALSIAIAGLLATPFSSFGQDTCEFEGSVGAATAAEVLQEIDDTTAPEAASAAFLEALGSLEREYDADNPVVYLLATQANLGLARYEEALRLIDHFDELAPECGEHSHTMRYNGWVNLYNGGIESYGGGDTDAALEQFALANAFWPSFRSYNNAALLQTETGDTEGAIATYREALAADMADADPEQMRSAIRGLGDLLLAEDRVDEALQAYSDHLERNPDDVVIRIRYALAMGDAGRADEAGAIFGEVMSRDDLSPQQWVEVGVGLYNSKDYENASIAFGKARAGNPYNKEAMENYVNATVLAGRPGPVLALADTLVAWYPYDQANYQLLASALARADMNERAMEIINDQEAADVVFHFVQMAPMGTGGYVVRGSLEAKGASGMLQIPFEFLDGTGQVVATETLSMPAPAAGQTESFELEVPSGSEIAGFRYRKSGS